MEELSTQDKLLKAGKEEFLAKGYKDASLREIGKKAGFTLGAFYGYYPNKEALFHDIVHKPAEKLYNCYLNTQTEFATFPIERQRKEMDNVSDKGLMEMIDIIYTDFDIFKLLFFCSAGTEYENYMQKFIDIEINSTYRFIGLLNEQGHKLNVDDELIHILASAMFSGMLEVVDHNMNKEKATGYITQLRMFYSAGWHKILGI